MKIICVNNSIPVVKKDKLMQTPSNHLTLIYKLTRVHGLTFGKVYDGLICYRDGEFYYNILDDNNNRVSFLKNRFRTAYVTKNGYTY